MIIALLIGFASLATAAGIGVLFLYAQDLVHLHIASGEEGWNQ